MMEDIESTQKEMEEVAKTGVSCFLVLILGVAFLVGVLVVIAIIVC